MTSRLGLHTQITNADFWAKIAWVQAVQPRIVKVISPDGEFCANVKRVSPNTLILARDIEDSGTAEDKWNRYQGRSDWHYIDIIEGRNEVKPQLGDEGRAQAQYELDLCAMAHGGGKKYCALSWGEGNPAEWWNDRAQWAEFLAIWGPVLREAEYIGLHEYWWPDWDTPEMLGWHTFRWRHWYDRLPADMYKPIIISEAGFDGDINGAAPGKGWRDILTPEAWAERMVAYAEEASGDIEGSGVVAIEIYDFKPTPDWLRFEWCGEAADALRDKILAGGGQTMPSIIDYRENVKAQIVALGGTGNYARRALSAIDTWVVHHVGAGDTGYPPDGIVRYHVQTLGWPGPGYHYFIGGDGKIYWLQDLENISYHCGNDNGHTVGVCLAGDFTSSSPTAAQLASLTWLVDTQIEWQLKAHRELSQTSCPGGEWFETWRIGVSMPVPPSSEPTEPPADTVIGRLEALEERLLDVEDRVLGLRAILTAVGDAIRKEGL